MSSNISTIGWNKLLAIVFALTLVGYVVARPTLERWWGVSLPSLTEAEPTQERGGQEQVQDKDPFQIPPDKQPPQQSDKKRETKRGNQRESKRGEPEVKWEWRQLDRGRLQSPAGLIYGRGPQGEHRVDHVLRHSQDDPGRPVHGVFGGSRDEIFQLLDEAYRLIGQKSKRVTKQVEGDRTEYTIRFDQAIGYEGGRNGQRNNYPKVNRLKLILEDDESVITAYPIR